MIPSSTICYSSLRAYSSKKLLKTIYFPNNLMLLKSVIKHCHLYEVALNLRNLILLLILSLFNPVVLVVNDAMPYFKLFYLDNNNCAPSFLRSLCEIGGDCFDRGIFLRERSSRRKIPRSKTVTDEFTQ